MMHRKWHIKYINGYAESDITKTTLPKHPQKDLLHTPSFGFKAITAILLIITAYHHRRFHIPNDGKSMFKTRLNKIKNGINQYGCLNNNVFLKFIFCSR